MALAKSTLDPAFSLAARVCENSTLVQRVLRHVTFRGKGRIVQNMQPAQLTREIIAECNGPRFRIDLSDPLEREVYFNIYESRDITTALDLVPTGGVCIDIGAHIGAFALPLAKKVGSTGIVHAFEPDPDVFSRLLFNRSLNNCESYLFCHQVAVSNCSGQTVFHRAPENSAWGSLHALSGIATSHYPVTTITLDEFLANTKITNVDLLKVDVEAHEPELLAGGSVSISRRIFRSILIEFNGVRLAERGKTLDDLVRPLAAAGYVPHTSCVKLLIKLHERLIAPEKACINLIFTLR
jgi:FkbM family methyltransferase